VPGDRASVLDPGRGILDPAADQRDRGRRVEAVLDPLVVAVAEQERRANLDRAAGDDRCRRELSAFVRLGVGHITQHLLDSSLACLASLRVVGVIPCLNQPRLIPFPGV
jgi:hypothetical protein